MKIQYNGDKTTSVRFENNGEKQVIKSGQIFDVSDERGKELLRYSSDFQCLSGEVVEEKKVKKEKKATQETSSEV